MFALDLKLKRNEVKFVKDRDTIVYDRFIAYANWSYFNGSE